MFRGQATGLDGLLKRLVVGFRLVRVGTCEARECPIGDVALAEEAGEHRSTGGAGVALCEQGPAYSAVVH